MKTEIRWSRAALALLVSTITLAVPFYPAESRAELAIGAARDFLHSTNANALVLRYDWRKYNIGTEALAWHGSDGTNGAVTLDFNVLGFFDIPVDFDLGGAYIANTTRLNGSRLNFQLTGAVNLGHFRVFFTHFSNAGIKPPNAGWNFAGLAWRF